MFGAIASALGSTFSSAANFVSAERQMDFQAKMSSNAHQREVEDLRKAGLNPILSATGGSGASTPSGAMARFDNPVPEALASAASAAQYKAIVAESKVREQKSNVMMDLLGSPIVKYMVAAPGMTGTLLGGAALLRGAMRRGKSTASTAKGVAAGNKLFIPERARYAKGPARFQLNAAKEGSKYAWMLGPQGLMTSMILASAAAAQKQSHDDPESMNNVFENMRRSYAP